VLKERLAQLEQVALENLQLKEHVELLERHGGDQEPAIYDRLRSAETKVQELDALMSKAKCDAADLGQDKTDLLAELKELQTATCHERQEKFGLIKQLEEHNVQTSDLLTQILRLPLHLFYHFRA